MEIRNSGAAAPVVTEYQDNTVRSNKERAPAGEAIGSQLNRMGGVRPEKNLYENKNALNKESFLKMMTEQLKFQDPFNPVKNENFTQQMAMLSQLEQQINMNENLEKMIGSQNNHQIAALQLVGKNISADKAAIYHDEDKPSAIKFNMPQDASEVKLEIKDLSGETIRTIGLGTQNEGEVQTKWDGVTDQGMPMPAGRYSYGIVAKDMAGNDIKISTKVDGRVTGVTSSQGVVFLLVGDQRIGLNDVEMIKEGGESENKATPPAAPLFGGASAGAPVSGVNAQAAAAPAKSEEKTQTNTGSESKKTEDNGANAQRLDSMMPLMFR